MPQMRGEYSQLSIAMAIRVDTDEDTADTMLKKWMAQRAGREDIEPERHENGTVYEAYSFHAGRVGDDLLILANSKNAFMDMFNLYTGESLPSKDFTELPRISGHTLARIQTAPPSSEPTYAGRTETHTRYEATKPSTRYG